MQIFSMKSIIPSTLQYKKIHNDVMDFSFKGSKIGYFLMTFFVINLESSNM